MIRSESWAVLEDYYLSGKLRCIGVSNYTVGHLQELLDHCRVVPHVLQIELHPHYQQRQLVDFCREKGIHVQVEVQMLFLKRVIIIIYHK